jgi:hypothetical protein
MEKVKCAAEQGCALCQAVCRSVTASGAESLPEPTKEIDIEMIVRANHPVELKIFHKKEREAIFSIALSGTNGWISPPFQKETFVFRVRLQVGLQAASLSHCQPWLITIYNSIGLTCVSFREYGISTSIWYIQKYRSHAQQSTGSEPCQRMASGLPLQPHALS